MTPNYGCPDYIARDLFREENGSWDRNPTTLHPASPGEAAAVVLSAIGDPDVVLERARSLAEAGETQLALHVVDLLALADGDDPVVVGMLRSTNASDPILGCMLNGDADHQSVEFVFSDETPSAIYVLDVILTR